MEEPLAYYIKPYFELLKNYEIDIHKNKLSIQNILEQQNTNIFHIIETLYEDREAYYGIEKGNLVDILIESSIRYTKGNHPFGNYARSIESLLLLYDLVGENIEPFREEFIDSLSGNIRKSTTRDYMLYGYDWNGLNKVEKYICLLKEEDVLNLIENIGISFTSKIKSIQLDKVINYSVLDNEKRKELIYEKLIMPRLKYQIKLIIEDSIKSYGYNYKVENQGYCSESESKLLYLEIDIEKNIVKYILIDKNDNDKEILNIVQNYIEGGTVELIVKDKKFEFQSSEQLEEIAEEVIEYIKESAKDELKSELHT